MLIAIIEKLDIEEIVYGLFSSEELNKFKEYYVTKEKVNKLN